MMGLTVFSIPKLFRWHIGTIQTNAIQSWTLLRPACEIILFGDEEGIAEVARRLDLRHIPEVARNEHGTPLLNSLFDRAQQVASHSLLCYVNADIILMSDFARGVERVRKWSIVFFGGPFLLVGRRWDLEVNQILEFNARWEDQLRVRVAEAGVLRSDCAIDYFVFSSRLWGKIPPFAIGRTAWDNWLIYRARFLGAPVINATSAIMAIHQNHDYSHNAKGKTGIFEGPEARRNQELAGGSNHYYSLVDAIWTLTPKWLRPAWGQTSRQRRKQTEALLSRECRKNSREKVEHAN